MNIYTQSFQLINCKELSGKFFNFLFKKYLNEIRLSDNCNGYEYEVVYQIFNSKYKFLNKIFDLSVYAYIKVKNLEFNVIIKDIIKQIKNKFEYTQKIKLYIILDINQQTIMYENCKDILNSFNLRNDLMIVRENADVLWRKNDIMIKIISERNKFLISDFNARQDIGNIGLFKKEFSSLLILMFKIMKTNIHRR